MPKGSEIGDFGELYDRMTGNRPFVGALLIGHLAVEFLLRKILTQYDSKLGKLSDSLRHHALIELNHQIGLITDGQRALLVELNTLRNKLAHQIMFEPTIDDLRSLWTRASLAFTDMTDGIEQGLGELSTARDLVSLEDWVFPELFVQICYDLHGTYVELGGDPEVFKIAGRT
jgi:hypothetical protein